MIDDGTNIQSAIGTTAGVLKVDLSATTANSTAVKVDGSAVTQPVSGTITANAGTNLNTSLLALDTSVNGILLAQGATTSGKTGPLIQCAVTTAAPTYTNAQLNPLSLTTSGALRVDIGATSANATAVKVDGSAVTQPVSGTIAVSNAFALDATLTGGTTKAICRGGAKGATTAADVTSTSQSVDRNALDVQIRTSAGVAVDTFGGGTQYADGDVRGTATGTLLMIDDGTNIQSAIGTTAGVLKVDLSATTANATAVKVDGSAVTQPVSGTITANAGTNLNTSLLALDTSVNGILLAQGATTSGKTGPLIQGAVTTAAPTYTTAQLDPLSLTTSGALRVDIGATSANATAVKVDGSAVTQPVSGTIGVSNAFALDATLTGGTAKSICRGGAKGATTAADVTSTSQSVDRNALDVQIRTSAGVAVDTFGGGTQYADGDVRGTATGTLLMIDDGTNIQSAIGTTAGVLKVDLSATTANATAVKVDGSAVTQPVSGTITANAGTNLNT